ncbi:hypothetical protein SO802_020110 [Lithocarpus litseifolius]|uniref:argininosuccinate synthase n=1 Tax=Lithocarpus litseifolius TaxID=425828 RepID=A0AAW2CB06_9ROSI
MGCICGKPSQADSPIGHRPKMESSFSPSKPNCSKPSTTESPRKSFTCRCGPLSAGKLKFGPCIRFLRKKQLQLAPRISKLVGHTIATINIGGSITKFCINQVIPAVLRSDREMAIAEATKGRGLCGKLNKVVLMDIGGLGTSVIVPWLSKPSTTKSHRKSSTGCCGPLSAGKLKFGPCIRFLKKTQLQLATRISKLVGHTIATTNIGGSITKFCINQVIPAVLQSDREMAIAEATKGRGLCGKLNKVVLTDSGGLGTSVMVPWLRENNGCDVGQGIGELEGLEVKDKASDASQLVVKYLKEEFVRNSIFLCSRTVAIYERKYLLGNSMACPVIEKGDILDPANKPKKDMNMLTLDPEEALETPEYIEVGIESGLPVSVMVLPPASLLVELNEIGGKHGIGQIDMVENQLVGMKSCGVYETLGGTILFATATVPELESLTID